jgi:hypothetical protein
MNRGLFAAQLNDIEGVLSKLDLLKERNLRPKYEHYAAAYFRKKTCWEIWQACYREQVYDFLLSNDAILQFRFDRSDPLTVSYIFLDCPFSKPLSREAFAAQQLQPDDGEDEFRLMREYDYYLANPEKKESVTPIRYDYNPTIYTPGRHPASHLHIGHANEIRVGMKKILLPLSFTLFVIRQCFPDSWTKFLAFSNAESLCRNIRENPQDVHKDLWGKLDDREMILT